MDEIKKAPHPWVTPGLVLPSLPLPSSPLVFKDLVLDEIAKRYGITIAMIRGRSRQRHLIYARQLLCYIMRDCYGQKSAYAWLGNLIDTDHSTVMKTVKSYKDRLDTDDIIEPKVVARIEGEKFTSVREDYNHFKLILYKCLSPETILSALVAISDQENTHSQSSSS